MGKYGSDEKRWTAVQQRDAGADEVFWYSVRSTGVYCRPSCGARPALRQNVAFHDSREAAEQAGFRPCLRCKPDQPPLAERQAAIVAQACRLIDEAEDSPDLDSLAEAVGVSRFYFHRMFKAVTGITPKAYANAARARRVQAGLVAQATVTDAMYAAGFNSSGRFYAQSEAVLGMTVTGNSPTDDPAYDRAISATDRAGLLYTVARILAQHHLSVQLAKVSTLGERVEDTFLVNGPALQQTRAQLQIESELLDALAPLR